MTLVIENVSNDFAKAIKVLAKLDNAKLHMIKKDDDTLWTKEDEKAWKKARRELEKGEVISYKELFKKFNL